MRFESRVFTLAKDADRPGENQDASWVDADRRRAAIADGVSSAIFSRAWARILVEAAVVDPPDPDDKAALARWLADYRQMWSGQIDTTNLAWFQKPKLREGAFSTLLWTSLTPQDLSRGGWWLRAFAIGDTCLFHLRGGAVLARFPVQCSAELDSYPMVLGSVDLSRDELLEFQFLEQPYWPGDSIVLCTDAVADWALRREEAGDPLAWEEYWDRTEEEWQEEILALRSERQIRVDDSTLVLLRMMEEPAEEPAEAISQEPAPAEQDWADRETAPAEQDWAEEPPTAEDGWPAEEPGPADAFAGAEAEGPVEEPWPVEEQPAAEPADEPEAAPAPQPEPPRPHRAPFASTCLPPPPPPPSSAPLPASAPPPAPPRAEPEPMQVLMDALRQVSGEVRDQLSEQLARGKEKFQEVQQTARGKLRKYWDRLRQDNRPDEPPKNP